MSININKKIMAGIVSSLLLVACSGSDDNDSSSGSENTTMNNTNTNTNNSIRLPDPDPRDNCILNNVVLSPPSGSTISTSETSELLVTLDFELLEDINDLDVFINLKNQANNDFAGGSDIADFSLDAGRHVINFPIDIRDAEPDTYTALGIVRFTGNGCEATLNVNYVITQ